MSVAENSLHESLVKSMRSCGFTSLTPVQQKTIPFALQGRDLLVKAQTGSGKTAAFLLPVLHELLTTRTDNDAVRALVLAPTRELAAQIADDARALAEFAGILVACLCGGEALSVQRKCLQQGAALVVATPGRLLEHLRLENLNLQHVRVLVLDEADRMLDMGFADAVISIISACPEQRQTLLLSATVPAEMRELADRLLQAPQWITIDPPAQEEADIRQEFILSDGYSHKQQLLHWLLRNEEFDKALVFTNTRDEAARLSSWLCYRGHRAAYLHGELTSDKRNARLNEFRDGRFNVLVASDLAARGLDVKGIELVINFELARRGDDYLHRIGRTGRAGEAGLSIAFIAPDEWNLKASIERYLKIRMQARQIPGLVAEYRGPDKLKKSGKAAGKKKRKVSAAGKNSSKKTSGKPAARKAGQKLNKTGRAKSE